MIFLYVFSTFLMVLGLFSLVRFVFLELLRIKNNYFSNFLLICINEKNIGDIRMETEIALSRISWLGRREFDGIIFIDCGLSDENRSVCEEMCKQNGFRLLNLKEKCGKRDLDE